MTLANVQGKLSRAEMRNVMAGVEDEGNACANLSEQDCRQNPPCESGGVAGKCGWVVAWSRCACATIS
jgi:hypothetical protein